MRLVFALLLIPCVLAGQQRTSAIAPVPDPVVDTNPFRRLELPTPNTIREGSGMPGRDYWQQRVGYVIRTTLDTASRVLSGEERVAYSNNSPDTLRYLWLQLDQNLFNSASRGRMMTPADQRIGAGSTEGGVTIEKVEQPALAAAAGRPAQRGARLEYTVTGTMMRVDLARPLPPRSKLVFDVAWRFPFLDNVNNRMGILTVDGATIYEVAQWYPRLAVYDDVRGWNTEQYLGTGEFYLEYGSFDVSITVPADMIVGATGTLRNPETVLTAEQRARLARAWTSDSTVIIRGKSEVNDPASRPVSSTGMLTWRFTADSVRDFAWAAARHFIWDAAWANNGKTLVQSLYTVSADSIWHRATEYGRLAINRYSAQWWPFPYTHATNVFGAESGMEYPMMVFCNRPTAETLYSVTDHEFGHTWFPMLVGNNERRYPWMDEGFNTFMNYYNWRQQYPGTFNRRGDVGSQMQYARSGFERPIMAAPDLSDGRTLGGSAYNKPGLALIILRDQVVGPERFDPAFREYIRRWQYKHPTPADFFRTMEDALGEDLSWFWRSWFYTTETLDQGVDSVVVSTDSAGHNLSSIYLRNLGPQRMPVIMDLLMDDGFTRRVKLPVEIWIPGNHYVATIPGPNKVTSVKLNPDKALPDMSANNDNWPRAP